MREELTTIGAFVRRDALLAISQPLSLITRWCSPVIAIAGFYFVARFVDPHRSLLIDGRHAGYFAYVSVNLSFMLLQSSALQAFAQTIRYDQLVGTLEPIVATSAPPNGLIVVGCCIWPLLIGLGQVGFSLGIASLFLGLDLHATNLLSLLTFVALSTLTMGAIGILGAAGVVAFKQVPPSNYLVGGAAALLSGTLFPTHLLPQALRFVSWCLPLTHALRGLRGAIAGDHLVAVAGEAVWLGLAAVVLLPLSISVFGYVVERARSDGTLAQY